MVTDENTQVLNSVDNYFDVFQMQTGFIFFCLFICFFSLLLLL